MGVFGGKGIYERSTKTIRPSFCGTVRASYWELVMDTLKETAKRDVIPIRHVGS